MALTKTITANGSRGKHKFTLTVTEKSTSIENNTSNVSFEFKISPIETTWAWEDWGESITYSIWIGGYKAEGSIPYYDGYSTITITKADNLTFTHNSEGKLSIDIYLRVRDDSGQTYTCGGADAYSTMALSTIPRYLSITSLEFTNITETSTVVKWTTSHSRSSTYYSFDNGQTWVGSATDGESLGSDGKSGNFNIKNLSPNTTYKIKIKFRRTDNSLWTESAEQSFKTYAYPYCYGAPDFTIGNAVTLDFSNPLKRSLTWQLIGVDGSIIAQNTTTEHYYKGINGDGSVANLYKSIPNAKSGKYTVKVSYGGNTHTKSGGTYSIRGTETPTVGTISYADVNSSVTAITANNQHIVQNKSNLKVSFGVATPKNNASIVKHTFVLNGVKKESEDPSGTVTFGTVNSAKDINLTVTVTDSRGLTGTATKKITMLAHSNPSALVTLERLNNYEDETYLTVDGSVSSINGKNTMAIKYRYKEKDGSYGSYVTIGDRAKQTLSLDKEKVFIFNVVVTDAFSATFSKEYTLNKGVFPLFIDTQRNSIGVGAFPKREKSLELNGGQIYLEREEANVEAIYMAKRSDTGIEIGFGVGKGGLNRGIYDYSHDRWLIHADNEGIYVNKMPFNEDTFGDSGWKTITFDGYFTHYNTEQTLKYRRIGKQVFLRGAMKPIVELGTGATKAFTLPEGYRPAQLQDFLCQGSYSNKWLLEITSAGVASVARYGTTEYIAIPTSAWLPISVSFLID